MSRNGHVSPMFEVRKHHAVIADAWPEIYLALGATQRAALAHHIEAINASLDAIDDAAGWYVLRDEVGPPPHACDGGADRSDELDFVEVLEHNLPITGWICPECEGLNRHFPGCECPRAFDGHPPELAAGADSDHY